MPLSEEKTELIKVVAREAVIETLTTMGIDAADPIATQQDMAYLRASRRGAESTRYLVKKAAVPIVVLGLAFAVWQGFGDGISEALDFKFK